MRRSLAPSIRTTLSQQAELNSQAVANGDVDVERQPALPFLSVQAWQSNVSVLKKFKPPAGAKRTQQSDLLLKRKTLGVRKSYEFIRPGKFKLPERHSSSDDCTPPEEEDDPEEPQKPSAMPTQELPPYEPLVLWESEEDPDLKIEVEPGICCKMREHQRQGVRFMFECVCSLRDFNGNGCILADDMGLGKTFQSITLLWTLFNQGMDGNPIVNKAMIVTPTSLVRNWEEELIKWLNGRCPVIGLSEGGRAAVQTGIQTFIYQRKRCVLVISYETFRLNAELFYKRPCCDLLICDEAHRLKNSETATTQSLAQLDCRRRILLSGTPLQNDLEEFYSMVNFTNPGVLGSVSEFRKRYANPILIGREPGASDKEVQKAQDAQNELSRIVNEFILRRTNTLNAQHLPPKLVQVVCCRLTPLQEQCYQILLASKDIRHIMQGKQTNVLSSIGNLQKLCNHPKILLEGKDIHGPNSELAQIAALLPVSLQGRQRDRDVHPEWSGKLNLLYKLMRQMRRMGNDRIVIVSNFTQTLDLISNMCRENNWSFVRLDGSTTVSKRQKLVNAFNDPNSNQFAFLLSSKAGGCGLNLIGANRLVLFDPDWNPAVDKQAAARVWREGQKKRCFIYRFLSTGTIEEKIFQRQLSKEGLQNIVDDKEEVNQLSSKDLKRLFKYRPDTRSDTHDKLQCKRCDFVKAEKAENQDQAFCEEQRSTCETFVLDLQVWCANALENAGQPADLSALFNPIISNLAANVYNTLPMFVRDLRTAVADVHQQCQPFGIPMQREFDTRWMILVPTLHEISVAHARKLAEENGVADDTNNEDEPCSVLHQPQEGMPLEEDLNSWSHHYNTTTCDDEAMRLAMRDDDTVSFAFGLEVTWDLIQQRMAEDAARAEQLAAERAEKEARRAAERAANGEGSDVGDGDDEDEDEGDEDGSEGPNENGDEKEDGDAAETKKPDKKRKNKKEEKEEKKTKKVAATKPKGRGRAIVVDDDEESADSADDDEEHDEQASDKEKEEDEEPAPKRGRKRAKAQEPAPEPEDEAGEEAEAEEEEEPEPVKPRGRGRPRKNAPSAPAPAEKPRKQAATTPKRKSPKRQAIIEDSDQAETEPAADPAVDEVPIEVAAEDEESQPVPAAADQASTATDNTSAEPASEAGSQDSGSWDCPTCTYKNEGDTSCCELCGSRRARRAKGTETTTATAASGAAPVPKRARVATQDSLLSLGDPKAKKTKKTPVPKDENSRPSNSNSNSDSNKRPAIVDEDDWFM